MMEQDRELLELAALAAGYTISFDHSMKCVDGVYYLHDRGFPAADREGSYWWNPLTDDGDALRLAVKLGLVLNLSPRQDGRGQTVVTYNGLCKIEEPCYDGEGVAARRAIVRAAAEIGRHMKEKA